MVVVSSLALLTAWGTLVVAAIAALPSHLVHVAGVEPDAALVPLWTFHDDSGGAFLGSAAIANFDADQDLEVAAFSESGKVYVLNADGTKSWDFQTEHGSIPPDHLRFQAVASPTFGDFDGDGVMEVVIGTNGRILYVLHDANHDGQGEILWSFPIGYWIHTTGAVADVDHDGILEVVIGADDRKISVLHDANHDGQGEVLWSYYSGYWVHSSPAVADMDADGQLDVVVGGEDRKISVLHDANHDGQGEVLWSYDTGIVRSSPAVADVNTDGVPDVVFGGTNGSVSAITERDHDGHGELLWSVRLGVTNSSPAIADVDGDGRMEVVVASTGGDLKVLDGNTGSALWSYPFTWVIVSSPALADIDADGELEVLIGADDWKYFAVEDSNHDGHGDVAWDFTAGGFVDSSPVVADLNDDDKLDVVFGSGIGNLYALTIMHSVTGGAPAPWPKFHGDQSNTGQYNYPFRRGDADGSKVLDIADAIFTLDALFQNGPALRCQDAGDANDDGRLTQDDAIFTLFYLFGSGLEPPHPGPVIPGPDPTSDSLTCTTYAAD